MFKQIFSSDMGLLVLRLGCGVPMLLTHGIGKIQNFEAAMDRFPDPLGVGSTTSLVLAIFAEVFCAAAVILGLKTRFAAFPLFFTMLIAFAVVHADDPWQKKELAFVYGVSYLALLLMGGGKYSLDAKLPSKG